MHYWAARLEADPIISLMLFSHAAAAFWRAWPSQRAQKQIESVAISKHSS